MQILDNQGNCQEYSYENGQYTDFLGKDDLQIETVQERKRTVQAIAQSYAEFKTIRHLMRKAMLRHEITGDARTVTYEDGTQITVNYSDNSYHIQESQ